MGFLQNDTNNIILDAVLTDKGRELLARNDGSFSILKFSPSDDEIDYTIIEKFGRTIGKEKLEKNTPVLEAITNNTLAQKYRLVSVSNPSLIRLPRLSFTGEGADSTNNTVAIGNTTVKQRQITVFQTIQDENSIDVELRDQAFVIDMSNLFLQIVGQTPDSIDSQQRASYILTRDPNETSVGGSQLTFTLATKAITEAQFSVYGAQNNKNLITTYVNMYGVQSGASLTMAIQITKTT